MEHLPPWPAFLSISTAAKYLDCSEGLVRKLLDQGLPSITIGRARRVPREALDAYLAARSAGQAAAPASIDALLDDIRRTARPPIFPSTVEQ
jgi:excisionase family DNA binding protein